MSAVDWKKFEAAVLAASLAALSKTMKRSPETLYAVAFHEFYAETHELIARPCLAANSIEALEENETSRWSSADWKWIQIDYLNADLRKLHRTLDKLAASKDEAFWNSTFDRFVKSFIHVARQLRPKVRQVAKTTKNFASLVFIDGDDGQILKRTTTPSQLREFFPGLEEDLETTRQRAAQPAQSQLEVYRKDISDFEEEIVRLGVEAIPMLREALSDPQQAWSAADCIGLIGEADPETVRILKRKAKTGHEQRIHETTALGRLGEVEFLLTLADSARTRDVAIQGLCSLYLSTYYPARKTLQLDYRPLERLLEKPGCARKVKKLYSGNCDLAATDVDEALRGLKSRHAVIREHAVISLGDRRLGKEAASRILPAVAARLRDRSPTVRRLAILSLSYWKKQAKPFAPDIRKLFKDPNPDVAYTARHIVKEIS